MNLYDTLEIDSTATDEQIRHAYRRLAIKHHPDKGGDAEKFKQIAKAYQILSNHDTRHRYDSSIPIPDTILSSPLKVFADAFNHWLSQYPIIEFIFKDSCHDVVKMLNTYRDNPLIKMLIESLNSSNNYNPSVDDILKSTNFLTADWLRKLCQPTQSNRDTIQLYKNVYVTLDDVYLSKIYPHKFSITNEDLMLSNDYQIVNPNITVNIPLEHNIVEIESIMHVINVKRNLYLTQTVNITLTIITQNPTNFVRINDYDLLIHVYITIHELVNSEVFTISYLNGECISFYNPHNCDLTQVYRVSGQAMYNKHEKCKGDLYILLTPIIHQSQNSMILSKTCDKVHTLLPVNESCVFRTDDLVDHCVLPTSGLIYT